MSIHKNICLRCGGKMLYFGQREFQLGKNAFMIPKFRNIMSNSMSLDVFICESCKKVEFYSADNNTIKESTSDKATNRIPKIPCPFCGIMHKIDDSFCPRCNSRL